MRLAITFILFASFVAAEDPRLLVVGQPVFDGEITLYVVDEDDVGATPLLAVGLDPLLAPLSSSKGDYWIGSLVSLIGLGPIPSGGRLDVPAMLPPFDASVAGVPIVCQALVGGALSNPATVPLDPLYAEPSQATIVLSPILGTSAEFGDRHAVGDLDDDGHLDLAVTAWREEVQGEMWAGQAYVLFGPDFSASVTISPSTSYDFGFFGTSAVIEDLDGDGIDDLMIGEPFPQGSTSPSPSFRPSIHVYLGGAAFSPTPSFSIEAPVSNIAYANFGRFFAVGHLDADGETDLAASVSSASVGGLAKAGRVEVYRGPGFTSVEVVQSPDPHADDFFGSRVAIADITGDGIEDLVAGSGREDYDGEVNLGRIHVFEGPTFTHLLTLDNPNPQGFNSRFGDDLILDDFDADGLVDIATADDNGRAYIFWGPGFDDHVLMEHPEFNTAADGFGLWMTSGDVNGDGLRDLLVSDVFNGDLDCPSLPPEGVIYAALGPYFSTFHRIRDKAPECGALFGWQMTVVDIDGDGEMEIVSGASSSDIGGSGNAGHVSIFDLDP